MARALKPQTTFVHLRSACEQLKCSRRTFWSKWHAVFTDPRPVEDRRAGCERKVYEDELGVAINEAAKGKSAVLMYRRLMRRL